MDSVHPRSTKPQKTNHGNSSQLDNADEIAPSEELMLRVEQIFEEAEQLWNWMYDGQHLTQ
jgi:hypothetical protein